MKTIDDGGPAIPCNFNMSTFEHEFKGMSLRDYLAAKALNGLLSTIDREDVQAMKDLPMSKRCEIFARDAYAVADAMLKARKL